METRPLVARDLQAIGRIDGTIESKDYLHLDATGHGVKVTWKLHEYPLRRPVVEPNALDRQTLTLLKTLVVKPGCGVALVADYDDAPIALVAAYERPIEQTLHVQDLRVDHAYRRQGIGTALLYRLIDRAAKRKLRAVSIETRASNAPAAHLLLQCGFVLSGIDVRRYSNHDIVKEAAALFWYAPLD